MSLSKLLASLLATLAVTLAVVVPAQANLLARDLDGNGVTDAFYDNTLNITWLRNANVNGAMNWTDANTWANNYTFGGYSDWRLPTMVDTGAPGCDFSYAGGTDCGTNVLTTFDSVVYSEMASLWYDTLGNKAYCPPGDVSCSVEQAGWGLTNTGGFENLQSYAYWLGTEYAPYANDAWYFDTYDGGQSAGYKDYDVLFAMAVRPGDVAAATVPEPESLLLVLTALAGLGLARRRRTLGASGL